MNINKSALLESWDTVYRYRSYTIKKAAHVYFDIFFINHKYIGTWLIQLFCEVHFL